MVIKIKYKKTGKTDIIPNAYEITESAPGRRIIVCSPTRVRADDWIDVENITIEEE